MFRYLLLFFTFCSNIGDSCSRSLNEHASNVGNNCERMNSFGSITRAIQSSSDLAGLWVSTRCEQRRGPEYFLRKYSFGSDGHFRLIQFYFSDPTCRKSTFSMEVVGRFTNFHASWIVEDAINADYELIRISFVPYTLKMAASLHDSVNRSCLEWAGKTNERSAAWKPMQKYDILPKHEIFSKSTNTIDFLDETETSVDGIVGEGQLGSVDDKETDSDEDIVGGGQQEPADDSRQCDFLAAREFALNELQLIRLESRHFVSHVHNSPLSKSDPLTGLGPVPPKSVLPIPWIVSLVGSSRDQSKTASSDNDNDDGTNELNYGSQQSRDSSRNSVDQGRLWLGDVELPCCHCSKDGWKKCSQLRPTNLGPSPLVSADINQGLLDDIQATIVESDVLKPPSLASHGRSARHPTPGSISGYWFNNHCTLKSPGVFFLRHMASFHQETGKWDGMEFYYSDASCQSPSFVVFVDGRFTVESGLGGAEGWNHVRFEILHMKLELKDNHSLELVNSPGIRCGDGSARWSADERRDMVPSGGCPALGIEFPAGSFDTSIFLEKLSSGEERLRMNTCTGSETCASGEVVLERCRWNDKAVKSGRSWRHVGKLDVLTANKNGGIRVESKITAIQIALTGFMVIGSTVVDI